MSLIDWLIVGVPLIVIIYFAIKSQKYVKGVADFLAAGRIAGRYVVSVASGEAALGLISVIALVEMYYQSGFAFSFWQRVTAPIGLIMGLVGFCTYRFRETKCLTMGQFFEIRYSRSLRVLASVIQSTSGIVNYAIFPAVGARFLIYFLDLPITIDLLGWQCPTFVLTMFIFLSIALYITLTGGQITVMVTDCVQGLLSYPMYVFVVGYLLYYFSWSDDIAPALVARAPEESFLNPYDLSNLRDFNLFYIFVGVFAMFTDRMSWGGSQGYNSAARSAHEAKMGALLGTWRGGFGAMIFVLLAIAAFTFVNSQRFADKAHKMRYSLAEKATEDILQGSENAQLRADIKAEYKKIKPRTQFSSTYKDSQSYKEENADPFVETTVDMLSTVEGKNKAAQTYRTVYTQMFVPTAIRDILPIGITGMFCALMIFLMLSTDTTYMHSWGSIIVQDFIVPLRQKAFSPKGQIAALRCSITCVCIFAFLFSIFFAQIDYILMFMMITGAIWSGAGVVITLGLYWKRGTTAGAFTALISGAVIALVGILAQQTWASHIYPYLDSVDLVPVVTQVFSSVSAPFDPYIIWEVNPHKFPINSVEINFISMIFAISSYIIVSLLTCKKSFNMDRMLHRGIYSESGKEVVKEKMTLKLFIKSKILGIDNQYTKGDKILAYSVFIYSFVYGFLLCFVLVIVWNIYAPWPAEWWTKYFFVTSLAVSVLVGAVSTIWFGICGTKDLFRLFRDLESKKSNIFDDGRVIDHVSVSDLAEDEKE